MLGVKSNDYDNRVVTVKSNLAYKMGAKLKRSPVFFMFLADQIILVHYHFQK